MDSNNKALILNDNIKHTGLFERYKGHFINRNIFSIPIYLEIFDDLYTFEFHLVEYGHNRNKDEDDFKPCSPEREKELEQEFEYYNFNLPKEGELKSPFFYTVKVFDKKGKEMPLFYGLLAGPNDYFAGDITGNNLNKFYKVWDESLIQYIYMGEIYHYNPYTRFTIAHYIGDHMLTILSTVLDKPWEQDGVNPKQKNEKLEALMDNLLNTYEDEGPTYMHGFERQISKIQDLQTKAYYTNVLDSFKNYVINNNIFQTCPKCGSFFIPKKGKKYCEQSCLISMANRRNYVRKLKNNGKIPTENINEYGIIQ